MGWAMLIGVALLTGALLWLIGFPRRLWMIAATALTLGATGYAWQGNPGMSGHPVVAEKSGVVDPEMVKMREAMFDRFTQTWGFYNNAENSLRQGEPAYAIAWMRSAVTKSPGDAVAWTGLGVMFAEHDRGVSPASRFAFDKAMALWPQHPGPPFFLGMAYAKMGALAEARQWWAKSLELTPPNAEYRDDVALWLERADAEIARRQAPQGTPPAP